MSTINTYGTVHEIPCLARHDNSRKPGTLCVEIIDRQICDARYGEPLTFAPGTAMRGWGDLDGPAYDVSLPHGAVIASVNAATLDAFAATHGVLVAK